MPYSRVPIFLFVAHYCNLRVYLHRGAVRTQYLAPLISICTLLLILECLGTSMYIGPHMCMSGYVSAYHGVGKLCILLHTVLCHAVMCTDLFPSTGTHHASPVTSQSSSERWASIKMQYIISRNGPYIGGHLAFYFKLNVIQVYKVL